MKTKFKSKTEILNRVYGGKWKYDGNATWWCDDEKRSVVRTAPSMWGDEPCGSNENKPIYMLHEEGKSPFQIMFFDFTFGLTSKIKIKKSDFHGVLECK